MVRSSQVNKTTQDLSAQFLESRQYNGVMTIFTYLFLLVVVPSVDTAEPPLSFLATRVLLSPDIIYSFCT